MKMEGLNGGPHRQQQWQRGGKYGGGKPLRSKEGRIRNYQCYLNKRTQQQPARIAMTKSDVILCFYCHEYGHYSPDCELKRADMEGSSPVVDQNGDASNQGSSSSGNGQRA
ncbi:hypothetical protein PI124_g18825 [Phytophthora idaei]|nr:hypothetical protein PI125_g19722 [Phytophthora idaei]KAG3135661.1 hypothetical protein PI126_g18159 [Phytophthora idaei]KAG3236164.1 hypothetical protein PI124_g18825 [Phytophthora idaei]